MTLTACGGDDDGGAPTTCEELAAIVAACQGGGFAEVEFIANVCDRFVLSSDCLQAWGAADCAEQEDEPSFNAICAPPCSDGEPPECRGDDAVRVCEDGTERVYRCQAVCGADGMAFAGPVGTSSKA